MGRLLPSQPVNQAENGRAAKGPLVHGILRAARHLDPRGWLLQSGDCLVCIRP